MIKKPMRRDQDGNRRLPKYRTFHSPANGEWVQPVMQNYLMSCCDCGLVHSLNFMVVWDKKKTEVYGDLPVVKFQAFRHKAWTTIMRMRPEHLIATRITEKGLRCATHGCRKVARRRYNLDDWCWADYLRVRAIHRARVV